MLANALGNTYTIKEPLAYWRRHDEASTFFISGFRGASLKSRINSSQDFGSELYDFRTSVSLESSRTMELLAIDHKDDKNIYNNLIEESVLFKKLAECHRLRSQLDSPKSYWIRLKYLTKMLHMGAYFGQKFYAFGWKSFLKDLHRIVMH
jgi:hypothetical protein